MCISFQAKRFSLFLTSLYQSKFIRARPDLLTVQRLLTGSRETSVFFLSCILHVIALFHVLFNSPSSTYCMTTESCLQKQNKIIPLAVIDTFFEVRGNKRSKKKLNKSHSIFILHKLYNVDHSLCK